MRLSTRLALLALGRLLLRLRAILLLRCQLIPFLTVRLLDQPYLILVLFVVILISLVLILILVILVLELILVKVIQALLELQRLARKPVDGARDELFLDVLAKLVVELQLRLDVVINLLLLITRRERWVEEVKEGRGRDALLDYTGLLGV